MAGASVQLYMESLWEELKEYQEPSALGIGVAVVAVLLTIGEAEKAALAAGSEWAKPPSVLPTCPSGCTWSRVLTRPRPSQPCVPFIKLLLRVHECLGICCYR